jgi:hypothetical protein
LHASYVGFMRWLEHSVLGDLMRDNGVWTYGVVNLVHIIGISMLFGSILVLDLRLLGAWPQIPLASLSRPTVRLAGIGFALAAVTGIGMLATKATDYIGNPFLFIKFPAIALGLFNIWLVHRSPAWRAHRDRDLTRAERRQLAGLAAVSLLCWTTALSAGRMIGYW